MTLQEFKAVLAQSGNVSLHWMLPDGEFVPAHAHVTEVGSIHKKFIDCGGVRRQSHTCSLQLWTADDFYHRLGAERLLSIIKLADDLFEDQECDIEVEYDRGVLSTFPLGGVEVTPRGLLIHLGAKHTACLAPDRCGVNPNGKTGCC